MFILGGVVFNIWIDIKSKVKFSIVEIKEF